MIQKKWQEMTKKFEGVRLKMYKCPAGKWTIGAGHNIEDNGITEDMADYILERDLREAEIQVRTRFPHFYKLNEARQFVLVDMCFNMGAAKLFSFKKMFAALAKDEYPTAAKEMMNSKWARQVGNRAKTLCEIMKSGVY